MSLILDEVEKEKKWPKALKWGFVLNIFPFIVLMLAYLNENQFNLIDVMIPFMLFFAILVICYLLSTYLYYLGITEASQLYFTMAKVAGIIGMIFSILVLLLISLAGFGVSSSIIDLAN